MSTTTPNEKSSTTQQVQITDYPTERERTIVFGSTDVVDPDGTDARTDRALTECLHVEKGEYSEAGFTVHSGSGESYAVDMDADGGPFCQCEDRVDACKHILRVGIENPTLLPGGDRSEERAATPGGSAERAQRETTRRGSCRSSEDGNENDEELATDGGSEESPEFPTRDGVACPHRMRAAISIARRWDVTYQGAKAYLREIGFYSVDGGDRSSESTESDANESKELATDGGCECDCGESGPPALSVGDEFEGSAGQTVEITDFTGSGGVRYTVRHESGHPLGSSVTGPHTLRQRLSRDGYEKVTDGSVESESTERDTDAMSGEETAQMLSDALTEYESVEYLYGETYKVETTYKMLTRADVTDIRAEGFTVAGRIHPHDDGTIEVVVEKVGEGR